MSAAALCARWSATIRQRNGPELWSVPAEAVLAGSIDSALSEVATAEVSLRGCDVPDWLQIAPRLHEVELSRDGESAFVGPVVVPAASDGELVLVCADRMWWAMNRRRLRTVQGDASTVTAALIAQAAEQGHIGLEVVTTPSGWHAEASDLLIGTSVDDAGARWMCRDEIVQVGSVPFATVERTYTADDWDKPPAVSIDGAQYAPTIMSSDGVYHASPGLWGESADVINDGDPRAAYLERSAVWVDSGEQYSRGPRVELSSGARSGDAAVSLRRGVPVGDWAAWRPGGLLRLAVDTRCGIVLGTRSAPVSAEITALRVAFGAGGHETSLSVDASSTAPRAGA